MALCIDSANPPYIATAQAALNQLVGVQGALDFTRQSYRLGGRYVVRVTEGAQIAAAQNIRPHSTTLVRRVIASGHWARIVESHANDCGPDKWFMDTAWSGLKSLVPFVSPDAGFMRKVTSTGSSSLIHWSGNGDQTANLSMNGTIRMEAVPGFVLLAHELVHADRIARGLLRLVRTNCTFVVDQRQRHTGQGLTHQVNQGAFQSAAIVNGNVVVNGRTISNANGVLTALTQGQVWVGGTMELAEEIATVGLSDDDGILPHDQHAITENMVRAEHQIHKRLKYGQFNQALA